jgi:beta-lactamase regulating signal transducer with metallopeptidase domain
MGIGTSIFLIAIGAILKFAVTTSISGIELATVGVILMVVGVVGLLISLFYLTRATERRDATVVRERRVDPYT